MLCCFAEDCGLRMHAGLFAEVCPSGVGAVQSAIVSVAAEGPAGTLLEFAL